MIDAAVVFSLLAASSAPCAALDGDAATRALLASAEGLQRLTAGDAEGAAACLELAKAAEPSSAVIARDLAAAYLGSGRAADALAEIESAIALGDGDPEARELRALALAALERPIDAAEAARSAGTWRGDVVAAALGDDGAAYRVAELVSEETPRGALTSLVLAGHASARGEETTARLLLDGVEALSGAGNVELVAAARALGETLDAGRGPHLAARVRAAIEHATNPAFLAQPPRVGDSGLRLALAAEAALHAAIGRARLDAALRVDQHVFVTQRSAFSELDLFGVTLAANVELPISRRPSAASVGLRARFTDTFGDRLRVHYATTIEGGPNLILPMSSALRAELGFYGIASDYVDTSPPDARISSLNRDLVGQRAAFALAYTTDWLDGRAEAMFLRDDALGDAFDALGGALGVRLRAFPSPGVVIFTGAGVSIREYGPVGDLAIIGPAATRTEVRTAIEIGARIAVTDALSVIIEDLWVRNNARANHSYTENVLSVGVEQRW